MPKLQIVDVSETALAKAKADLAARCVRAEVTGDQPIRDAISRESVEPGGFVHLDPQHTMLEHLVRCGAIRLASAGDVTG